MKKVVYTFSLLVIFMALATAPALAARPSGERGSRPGGGTSGPTTIGYDVSYPQCGKTLPNDFAFATVGVNGGTATTYNECLPEQLIWAQKANGSTSQQKVQLYVNTANPWDDIIAYNVTSWPTDNIDQNGTNTYSTGLNPYGECVKTPGAYLENTNSMACSWQYGWERAVDDVNVHFIKGTSESGVSQNPQDYKWWLDVEITNSWQTKDPNAFNLNRATLEGMVAYFVGIEKLNVGVYSTNYQYGQIVGNTVGTNSNLYNLDSWLAGARGEKDARNVCKSGTPLTAGSKISLVQYVSKNLDHNVSC